MGMVALRLIRQQKLSFRWYWDIYLLSYTIIIIGVGSFLFHTFANAWSALADDTPIRIFMLTYLISFSTRVLSLRWWGSALIVLAFIALTVFFMAVWPGPGALNGSIAYMPALLTLGIFTAVLVHYRLPVAGLMFIASVVFTVSVTLRSLDMAVCESLPVGVHYFWHLFNAILLYLLVVVLVRHNQRH